MTADHDPLCDLSRDGMNRATYCHCQLIARVRADERERKMAAADIAFLDAVTAREELAEVRERIAQEIEAAWLDSREGRGVAQSCARIARGGTR